MSIQTKSYTLLDGKKTAEKIKEKLRIATAERVKNGTRPPHLAAILVGENAASLSYVRSKVKSCEKIGFGSTLVQLPKTIKESELLHHIEELNDNRDIDGFIVQLPLPDHISVDKVIGAIDPRKDVDGFHPVNIGKMVQNQPCFLPATPRGILMLLKEYKIETEGKKCVILGRSNIVGRPMSILMSRSGNPGNATVTVCHSRTKNVVEECASADILIAAIGKSEYVKANMVKEGGIVIDVGINRVDDASRERGYRLCGDVDFKDVASKTSFITPVPGGVGPMTVTALIVNTFEARYGKDASL